LVILGGGVISAGEVLLSAVKKIVKARIVSMPVEAESIKVKGME